MKKIISVLLTLILLIGLLSGCSNEEELDTMKSTEEDGTVDSLTNYPITIDNNGLTLTYEKAPEKVVVVEYPAAEILVALGLEDKIVALAPNMNTINEVMPKYRDIISSLPVFSKDVLNNGTPTLEAVLSYEPDFVYGTSYTYTSKACGAIEDYRSNNINIYATEGTYVQNPTLENLYHDIENIGKIFNVQDRAEKLIKSLRERETAVTNAINDVDLKEVFVFDYNLGQGMYLTTGGNTLEDHMITLAGGENIFEDLKQQYANVSAEEIIRRNPEYVIVTNYFTAEDGQTKVNLMKSSEDFKEIKAVQDDNFLILSGLVVWPSLQSLDALESIAKTLHPEVYK